MSLNGRKLPSSGWQGDSQRVALRVMGISYTQIQKGAYALILAEINGPYRIPVVIGTAEAQSIAMKMEEIVPPRPLTHDLVATMMQAFGLSLKEVFISKFEDGIFSSELTFEDLEMHRVVLDARTSDAIALAMRTGAPIFTTKAIVKETGFLLEEVKKEPSEEAEEENSDTEDHTFENYTVEELENTLSELIDNEEYEQARRVLGILDRKRKERDSK